MVNSLNFVPSQTGTVNSRSAGGQVPDWLSRGQLNRDVSKLLETYDQIPEAFSSDGSVATLQNEAQFLQSRGGQAANSAASEFATRSLSGGGTGAGAGALRAQTLLPFLEGAGVKRTEAANRQEDSRREGLSLAANVADSLARLNLNYTSVLAGFISGQNQLNAQRSDSENQFNLSRAELGLRERSERARQEETLRNQRLQAAQIEASMPSTWEYRDRLGRIVPGGVQDPRNPAVSSTRRPAMNSFLTGF